MAKSKDIERVQTLTGEKDEDLIEILLDDAEAFVPVSYTHLRQWCGYGI